MRTAEIIVNEYLERGYSLESLRVLAESRSEPLCSEMLAILGTMRDTAERHGETEAPADAGPLPEDAVGGRPRSGEENGLFFVADDDEAVSGEEVIDFDIMAEVGADEDPDALAADAEESVADIVIGYTDGSEMVGLKSPEEFCEGMVEVDAGGIWSRLWSQKKAAAEAEAPEAAPLDEDAIEAASLVEEPIPILEPCAAESAPVHDEPEIPTLVDNSADYIPGSVTVPLAEAGAGADCLETAVDLSESPLEEEAAKAAEPAGKGDPKPGPEPETLIPSLGQEGEPKTGRKERRRRRDRKAGKRDRKDAGASQDLPEIVLAHSEGTDTMVPEQAAPGPLCELIRHITMESFPTLGNDGDETASAAEPSSDNFAMLDMDDPFASGEPPAETAASGLQAPEEGEHLMIIAGGGLDLRDDAYRLLAGAFTPEELADTVPEADNNVIRFRDLLPAYDGMEAMEEEEEDIVPSLHLVPHRGAEAAREEAQASETAPADESAETPDALSPMARMRLARACGGLPPVEDMDEAEEAEAASEHVILSLADDSGPAAADNQAQAELLEQEYQERLDEFAKRILEAQALTAESEARVRERAEAAAAREEEAAELRKALEEESEKQRELAALLDAARNEAAAKGGELERYQGLQDEHERLYGEFEDLRRAYNEVVTDVMPELQNERDDLALTVERQSEEVDSLRGDMGTVRRRLAAGYSLAAAACLVLVALPVANWLKSGEQAKELAMDHQRLTEQRERLDQAERQNIESEKTILNLRREIEMAKIEVAQLEEKNTRLVRTVDQHARDLASVRSGTPSRTTSNLALQGEERSGGRLRVNEVRDPAGHIERTVVANRGRRQGGDEMAANNGLRPPAAGRNAGRTPLAANAAAPARGETSAKVKAGEGVAQVVYRVLGTREPEVIDWVIRENKIRRDRRGNPLIYENQELRLPANGRTTQAASASRR